MLDAYLQKHLQRPLTALGSVLSDSSIQANTVTLIGFGVGLAAIPCLATQHYGWALGLIGFNRFWLMPFSSPNGATGPSYPGPGPSDPAFAGDALAVLALVNTALKGYTWDIPGRWFFYVDQIAEMGKQPRSASPQRPLIQPAFGCG